MLVACIFKNTPHTLRTSLTYLLWQRTWYTVRLTDRSLSNKRQLLAALCRLWSSAHLLILSLLWFINDLELTTSLPLVIQTHTMKDFPSYYRNPSFQFHFTDVSCGNKDIASDWGKYIIKWDSAHFSHLLLANSRFCKVIFRLHLTTLKIFCPRGLKY